MKEDKKISREIKGDRERYSASGCSAVRLLSSIITCILLSPYPAESQETLSLDQVIRQAQDSTIMAFQSRHEYDYYTLHYDEFIALRKPQLNLRVAPN